MDSPDDNSAKVEQDDNHKINIVNVIDNSCGRVNDDDDDDDEDAVEHISKATTSGSSSNPRGAGKREDDEEVRMKNDNKDDNMVRATMQPSSSPTTMITKMMIIKGKRTKRHRLHSPVVLHSYNKNNNDDDVAPEEEEEEDEVEVKDAAEQLDMANCLILLAQGQSPTIRRNEVGLFTKLSISSSAGTRKFSSENSKRAYCTSVYECKTCNRTFPSFQALGGHRASHKKLKITATDDFRQAKHSAISDNNHSPSPLVMTPSPSALSLQLGNINYYCSRAHSTHNSNKSGHKVHECSICGAGFGSGQALGGHMRRHRGPAIPLNSSTTTTTTTTTTTNNNNNPTANTTLSLNTAIAVESADTAAAKVNRIHTNNHNGLLSLDLNLPASPSPEDKQLQSQQQSAMVFSTPVLVDCFY